jgi:methionyl-tRNA formyltransferase
MRVVAFCNNHVGLEIVRALRNDPSTELAGLVVHPEATSKFRSATVSDSELPAHAVIDATQLTKPEGIEWLKRASPEMGVSAFFGYILKRAVLEVFPRGVVNIHPAYLPHNRGSYPNVWSIIDQTPAGATIHLMDEGVDTGPIIAQREVEQLMSDTGATLYRKLESACVELFLDWWPKIAKGNYELNPQELDSGSTYRRADVARIDRLELDERTTARQLLDRLRARTFSPHPGCYFINERGERVYVRVEFRTDSSHGGKQ